MEKILTQDQKHIGIALEELVKTPWRKLLEEYVKDNIKSREDMLLGKTVVNVNLDEVKFNQSTVIRWELAMLYSIVDYPTNITKKLGVYQTT